MTRKSKREIERAVEDLADGAADSHADAAITDRYDPRVREFVHQIVRDILSPPRPDDVAQMLENVRAEYGIDEDRDAEVVETAEQVAAREPSSHWDARDVIGTSAVTGPELLDSEERERFEELLADGREDPAAALIVETVYHWLADDAGERVAGTP